MTVIKTYHIALDTSLCTGERNIRYVKWQETSQVIKPKAPARDLVHFMEKECRNHRHNLKDSNLLMGIVNLSHRSINTAFTLECS